MNAVRLCKTRTSTYNLTELLQALNDSIVSKDPDRETLQAARDLIEDLHRGDTPRLELIRAS